MIVDSKKTALPSNHEIKLRRANSSDARILWEWRNDPETRANSQTTIEVAWHDHQTWLRRQISDPSSILLIGECDGSPVGTVRFDPPKDGTREISITVAPSSRGKGLGAELLKVACNEISRSETVTILARVRESNISSQAIFAKIGFVPARHEHQFVIFHLLSSVRAR